MPTTELDLTNSSTIFETKCAGYTTNVQRASVRGIHEARCGVSCTLHSYLQRFRPSPSHFFLRERHNSQLFRSGWWVAGFAGAAEEEEEGVEEVPEVILGELWVESLEDFFNDGCELEVMPLVPLPLAERLSYGDSKKEEPELGASVSRIEAQSSPVKPSPQSFSMVLPTQIYQECGRLALICVGATLSLESWSVFWPAGASFSNCSRSMGKTHEQQYCFRCSHSVEYLF